MTTHPPLEKSKFGSREFWKRFGQKYWERSPVVMKKPSGKILEIDANLIFNLLVKYCDRAREMDSTDGLKFYVNGVRLESFEAIEELPTASDKSLQGYHRRMSKRHKDYGLVCDKLLNIMDGREKNVAALIRKFMHDLYEHVGLPNRLSEIGLYLGNYRKTPFGVHVDKCGVLSFPVVGTKRFRLWEPGFVAAHPELKESFQYDEFTKQSEVLICKTGEIAYWPSSHWHIAESDGTFSATWSIGIWVDQTTTDLASELVSKHIEKTIRKSLKKNAHKTAHWPGRVPREFDDIASALSNLSKKDLKQIFEKWWKAHSRSAAFKKENGSNR